MTVRTNSGLQMFMESAIASSTAITGITLAAPGVLTSTAHGLLDGDVVLIECLGTLQLNGRLFKVVNKTTNDFQIAGPDGVTGLSTVGYTAFTSGTVKKVTLGTTITGCMDFNAAGGDIKTVDTTTVHDTQDTEIVVGATAQSYDMTVQWDPAAAAQQAMKAAFIARANKAFKIRWPDGAYILFYGTVGYTGAPGGGKQGVTTSPAKISMLGSLTEYVA
jgi:Phage tail tube protein, TTP